MAEEEERRRGTRQERDSRGDGQEGKETPEERGDTKKEGLRRYWWQRGGVKGGRWQIRKGGRRKERRSSEVMEILYGGLVS